MSDFNIDLPDVIDSYFIESELVDINQSTGELVEQATYNQLTDDTVGRSGPSETPIGKRVV